MGDFFQLGRSVVHVLNWVSRDDVGAGAVLVAVTLAQETFFYRLDSIGSGFGIMDFFPSSKVARQIWKSPVDVIYEGCKANFGGTDRIAVLTNSASGVLRLIQLIVVVN
jgi:hypothetical protein